jgi:hypothetical protein
MAQARFVVNPVLTSITQTYRNARLIADEALPRITVDGPLFNYTKYNRDDAFTVPNTLVGRKGRVPEIEWGSTQLQAAVEDHGLDDVIPNRDIDIANAAGATNVDPEERSTELLTDLLALDREVRVATLVFDPANYPSGNKTTLSGSGQWSDTTSDPIAAILTAFDSMLIRPTTGVLGRAVYTKLIQHPKVVAAVYPNGGNASVGGKAALAALADILELDSLFIGEGFVNTAKPGQTATMARVWGKHAAFYTINPLVQSTDSGGLTFGFTAEWGERVSTTMEEPLIGLRGGVRVRVGESVKELITASDLGYLFTNAVA